MSTTSTATALAACNCTPGDGTECLNHTCVLVLAKGNGTLFDAASIQEEDITELCVEVGHSHPKCVLWLLAMELFQSSDEMLAVVCRVTKAMACHKEPIRLCTSPLSTAHLRAYIAGRDG